MALLSMGSLIDNKLDLLLLLLLLRYISKYLQIC